MPWAVRSTFGLLAASSILLTTEAAATVSVTSKLNPSSYGQSVKFSAKVTDPDIPGASIIGTMNFLDGGLVFGNATVVSGAASLSTKYLTGGAHSITAVYWPTTGGSAAASGNNVEQQVRPASSTTTITTTNPSVYNGRTGAIKAKVKAVSPGFGVPTGTVDFYTDPYDPNNTMYPYFTAGLDATGTVVLDFMYLTGPGTYTLTAVYSGDINFQTSVRAELTQTVLTNAPIAGASFSPTTIAPGGTSRLTVSATNPTPYAMNNVALGVQPHGSFAIVSRPAGAVCGARTGLYYCMISVPAGATRSLVLQMTSTAPETIAANSYARNTDTMDETYATATLTVQ